MPYDSNGNASINRNRAVTGQTVQAAQVNTPFDDVQSMLSQVLLRSGVAPMTGNLNMNNFRITNSPDATNSGDLITLGQVQSLLSDPWATKAIGELVALDTSIAGVPFPPKDRSYRYIYLSSGETGSGKYNEGILTGESVSGIYPNINATAVISMPSSPLNGRTIRLINTERRFIRPGSAGVLEDSQNLFHTHPIDDPGHAHNNTYQSGPPGNIYAGGQIAGVASLAGPVSFNTQAAVTGITVLGSGGNESRPRNVGADFFMRIL